MGFLMPAPQPEVPQSDSNGLNQARVCEWGCQPQTRRCPDAMGMGSAAALHSPKPPNPPSHGALSLWQWGFFGACPTLPPKKKVPQSDSNKLMPRGCATLLPSTPPSCGDRVFGATSSEPPAMQCHLPGVTPSHPTCSCVPSYLAHHRPAHGTVLRLCHPPARGQMPAHYPMDFASLHWVSAAPTLGMGGGAGMGPGAGLSPMPCPVPPNPIPKGW